MVHLKLSVFVLALALSVFAVVAVESEISEKKVLAPPPWKTDKERLTAPPGHSEEHHPDHPPSHHPDHDHPPSHHPDYPPSHHPDYPPSGHGDCYGSRPEYCYQTDYCYSHCYSNPSACYAGGLGDYYCNQYCSHTYGDRWYGRSAGCYCYCYRED